MDFQTMGDKAILQELGRRIQTARLDQNLSQAVMAVKAGISRRALQHLEAGQASTLPLLIRIMRVLGKLDSLEAFLPEPGPSPLQLAKLKGRQRMRASGKRSSQGPGEA